MQGSCGREPRNSTKGQTEAARAGDDGKGAAPPHNEMGPDRDDHRGQAQGTELPGAVGGSEIMLEEQEVHHEVLSE